MPLLFLTATCAPRTTLRDSELAEVPAGVVGGEWALPQDREDSTPRALRCGMVYARGGLSLGFQCPVLLCLIMKMSHRVLGKQKPVSRVAASC